MRGSGRVMETNGPWWDGTGTVEVLSQDSVTFSLTTPVYNPRRPWGPVQPTSEA